MADKKISALTGATTPLAGTEVLPIVQGGSTVKVSAADITAGRAVSALSQTLTGGNLTFSGTAQRISADTSAAAQSDRLLLQSNVTNGNTFYGAIPNGTSQTSGLNFLNSSAANNCSSVSFRINATEAQIISTVVGTASFLPVTVYTGGVKTWTFDTAGNLAVAVAGKGIDFSANTHAAGMTSELLDWYEEGAWTPTMTSASGTTTVNSSSARYTRIGDKVFVVFQINYSTDASVSTSDFTIGGLPFTSRATFNSRGFVTSSNWTGSDYNDGYLAVNAAGTTISWAGRAVNQSSRTNAILLFVADYFAA